MADRMDGVEDSVEKDRREGEEKEVEIVAEKTGAMAIQGEKDSGGTSGAGGGGAKRRGRDRGRGRKSESGSGHRSPSRQRPRSQSRRRSQSHSRRSQSQSSRHRDRKSSEKGNEGESGKGKREEKGKKEKEKEKEKTESRSSKKRAREEGDTPKDGAKTSKRETHVPTAREKELKAKRLGFYKAAAEKDFNYTVLRTADPEKSWTKGEVDVMKARLAELVFSPEALAIGGYHADGPDFYNLAHKAGDFLVTVGDAETCVWFERVMGQFGARLGLKLGRPPKKYKVVIVIPGVEDVDGQAVLRGLPDQNVGLNLQTAKWQIWKQKRSDQDPLRATNLVVGVDHESYKNMEKREKEWKEKGEEFYLKYQWNHLVTRLCGTGYC